MLKSEQKRTVGCFSHFHWKAISYITIFFIVISLLILINTLFNPLNTAGTDELGTGTEEKHPTIITDNKKTKIIPTAIDNSNNLEIVSDSSKLANSEPASPSGEDNKQYIHSFNLWLEPDEVISTLVYLLSDDDAMVRLQAVSELAAIDSEETVKILAHSLDDQDSNVRSEVIYALGESKNNSEHFLGQVIFSEKVPFLRRQAVELLASRDSPAAHSLVIAARNDRNEQVREEAEYWIDSWGRDEDIMVDKNYRNNFFNDINVDEKINILQSVIIDFGHEEAVGIFQKILLQEEDPSVRLQSIMELTAIEGYHVEAALATALGDDDIEVRHQAIEELSSYGTSATHFLGQAIFSDPDPELRRRAYEFLILQDNPAADALISEVEKNGLEVLINSE